MPRYARRLSASGIYHIMLRGINQQQIFEDEQDCVKFLQVLQECKEISAFKLYAYCLMGNHIHLMIQVAEEGESLGQIFKRIGSRFVYWYNVKYQRVGHLFQDRFKSEVVEDDAYFLTVLRYIHQNPIKAGLCDRPDDYAYSSYREYLQHPKIVDVDFALQMMSQKTFKEFHLQTGEDECLDIEKETSCRLTDEQAQYLIQHYSNCKNVTEFQALDIVRRDECLKTLREKGLSIRQISRLTGVSIGIVRKFG